MIKGVIFDMDGVLLDSEPVNRESVRRMLADFGYPFDPEDGERMVGRHILDIMPAHFSKKYSIPEARWKEMIERCDVHYYQLWDKRAKLMNGVTEVLDELSDQGMVIALATTSESATVERFFNKSGLRNMFSFVLTCHDVTKRKPDPEIYLKAKEKSGLENHELLVVEDTSVGLASAKAAGLRCVVVPNEYTRSQDFSAADHRMSALSDLLELLNVIE